MNTPLREKWTYVAAGVLLSFAGILWLSSQVHQLTKRVNQLGNRLEEYELRPTLPVEVESIVDQRIEQLGLRRTPR